MDRLSGRTPAHGTREAADGAPPGPAPLCAAVLDATGVIVAADDRWAAEARDPASAIGALGTVGARYQDVCEAQARERPELRDNLVRLATAVRNSLAGEGAERFAYSAGERTYAAHMLPVEGAGEAQAIVALSDTTELPSESHRVANRELRRRYETLFDSLEVGLVLQDPEGRAMAWNPSAERLLGLSADQLTARAPIDPRWSMLHEDGWPLPYDDRPSRVAMRTRRPCRDATVGIKHPDGRVTWTSVNAHPLVREGEERPYAVAVSYNDVTEAHGARDAERRSQDRFRSLIEYSSDVITIVDHRGRVTYESPSVEAMLGYAPGALPDFGRLALVHPDDVGAAVGTVTALLGRPGASAALAFRMKAADGRWRALEAVATNRLHDPAVTGIVLNTRDVTDRRAAEAALRATTSRLENLVQNLQAGVVVADESRRIALVNDDFRTVFGIDAPLGALLGADFQAAMRAAADVAADPAGFVVRIEELIEAREPVHGEEVAFADGRTFERDYIPVSSGRLDRGHLWIYRDISRRKAREREAARLRDEAIRASRVKSEFLATMSHEIRTPMNGVIGTIELLLDTELEPHQRDLVRLARDSAYGLLSIVGDALDLSKIEAEKLEPRRLELDLAAVAEGVADVVLSPARRKGISLSVYVDPRIGERLVGDPQWLHQALVNLAGNAVKFTDDGEVRIRVELESRTPRTATVRFSVHDTGIGIPEEARERLFEPFVQLDSTSTRSRGGTGLGLAICQRLVRLMGGEVEVDSEPGRGSTFSFALTLRLAGAPPQATASLPSRALRVLVVEPRDATAAIATDYLGAWGVQCARAASAWDAAALAEAAAADGCPFDVAIVGVDPAEATLARALPGCERMALVLLKDVDTPAPAPGMFAAELTRPLKQAQLYEAVMGAADPLALAAPATGPELAAVEPLPAGTRVLVAEDNEVNRELLVRQLVKLGAEADAVAGGRDAIDAAASARYDAVLMDLHMPELDGPAAARAIRALPGALGAVPIVAVTAGDTPTEREACRAAGMDDFLAKPVTSRALADALRRTVQPAVDADVIDRLAADLGDREEVRRIARIYLEQLSAGSAAVEQAAARGDAEAIRAGAHRLGSVSATFGAARLAAICERLESDSPEPGLAAVLALESVRAAAELRDLLELG